MSPVQYVTKILITAINIFGVVESSNGVIYMFRPNFFQWAQASNDCGHNAVKPELLCW